MCITELRDIRIMLIMGSMWSDGVLSKRLSIEGLLWFACVLSLFVGAILLRPITLAFALIWIVVTAIVVPLHLYKAWRKLAAVPNPREYAVSVLLETIFATAVIAEALDIIQKRS